MNRAGDWAVQEAAPAIDRYGVSVRSPLMVGFGSPARESRT